MVAGSLKFVHKIENSPEVIEEHRRCGNLLAPGFSPGSAYDRKKPPMQNVGKRVYLPVGEMDQMLFNENL